MTDTITILDAIADHLSTDRNRWPDKHGEYHADCPYCHKPAKPKQTHFTIRNSACFCQVCKNGGPLRDLADYLNIDLSGVKMDTNTEYDYRGPDGDLRFQVVKYYKGKEKLFYQRHLDDQGQWVNGLNGTKRVPYRLPELIEASKRGEVIYIVEGEKDVDTLRMYGLAATTNSGGAGNWRNEYNVWLQGCAVVILPDNDDVGEKHAEQVATALQGTAKSIAIVRLPGLPDKGDVSDWLSSGHTIEELQALATQPPQAPIQPTEARRDTKPDYVVAPSAEHTESAIILNRLHLLGYSFRLNLCTDTVEVNGRPLSDITAAKIRMDLRDIGLTKKIKAAEDAYIAEAEKNAYHPVKDYLNGLKWDGENHIRQLADYLKSDDPPIVYQDGTTRPLHYVYLYRWLIGAVAKVFDGKQNPMLVWDGGQGIGKSTLARRMCGGLPAYFIEGSIKVEDKDSDIRLISRWIWEVSELDATTRKADQSALKSFITKETVSVRKPYGRYDIVKPAMASLIGTVNNTSGFLADESGSRRFMITRLTAIDKRYMDMDIDQVWAQAVDLYHRGASGKLTSEEAKAQREINEKYEVESVLDDWIEKYYVFDPSYTEPISLADIISELIHADVRVTGSERHQSAELSRTLTRHGAKRIHTRIGKRWIGLCKV